MKRLVAGLAVMVALAADIEPARAQQVGGMDPTELRPVILMGGIAGQYARTVGEFRDYVRDGFGINGSVIWPVTPGGPFALRGDGGFIVYGNERRRVCMGGGVGCFIELDLTTTNSIAYVNVGPQLMVPAGPIQPYAAAGVGLAYFATRSEVEGSGGQQHPFASTTNFDDFTFQWGGGGGLLVPLSRGRTPVMLDLGVRYHGNGRVEYLTEGDIAESPDGSLEISPTRSDANLLTFQIGVVVGARRGEPR